MPTLSRGHGTRRECRAGRCRAAKRFSLFEPVEHPLAAKDLIVEFADYDLDRVIATQADIGRYNPQRFEMEQLDAVVFEDTVDHRCVGYKDITPNEFWVRGHMPGYPLMPGVMMCEAAAQLISYFSQKHDLLGTPVMGFGGLDEVRFRDPVLPGDRLVLAIRIEKIRRGAMVVCRFQGFVRETLVVEGGIKGVPLAMELPAAI